MYIPGGGLIRLRESMSQLAESELKIAQYILENPTTFVNLTVQELAHRSGGSNAAVVRLWKSLGFEGYHDFKLRVASDLQASVPEGYSELHAGGSFESILQTVQDSSIQSIAQTLRLLKENDIARAANALLEAERTLTFGVGASGLVADDFALKLLRIGLPVHSETDFHRAAITAAQLREHDVFVAVSYSGHTSEVAEVAQIARDNGATVISITRFGETPLTKLTTIPLYISAAEPKLRVAATASRIAALTMIDTLFIYLANRRPDEVYVALENTRAVIRSHKLDS